MNPDAAGTAAYPSRASIAVVATIAAALSAIVFSLGIGAYERKMEMSHV